MVRSELNLRGLLLYFSVGAHHKALPTSSFSYTGSDVDTLNVWSSMQDSNPYHLVGGQRCYHYTNTAYIRVGVSSKDH